MQPVGKESCGEHQLHLGQELLVEAGVDDPRVEKSENNVEGIGFKEDGREWSSNGERFKPAHHRDIDAVKERTRFFASSSRHCFALAPHLLNVEITHVH